MSSLMYSDLVAKSQVDRVERSDCSQSRVSSVISDPCITFIHSSNQSNLQDTAKSTIKELTVQIPFDLNQVKNITYTIKLVVTEPLPFTYIQLSGGLLTAKTNGELSLGALVDVNDYIELRGEGIGINGIYQVISLGSVDTPWVIRQVDN